MHNIKANDLKKILPVRKLILELPGVCLLCISKEKEYAKRLFVSVIVAALTNISEIRKTQIVDAKTGPFAHAGYSLPLLPALIGREAESKI